MQFRELPKVELHLHLDCSLSYKLVKQLKPETTADAYRQSFIAPPKCTDLADYITRAISAIQLMQTKENLRMVVDDLFEQLGADRVIYAEMRFAPLEHQLKGLSPEEVVDTVNDQVTFNVKRTGIQAGIILCTLRHYSAAQSMHTVQLVEKFKGTRVMGFDIASDEAGYPIDNHVQAFEYANQHAIKCTAHAGEAKGPESVWETLNYFKPLRIGHGVRSMEDKALIDHLVQNEIHLEVCPTSNIQTDVFHEIHDHNINKIFESGVSLSVNTDCRTISDVNLDSEYQLLDEVFRWSSEHFYRCNMEAIKHAFCDEIVKREVQKKLEIGFLSHL